MKIKRSLLCLLMALAMVITLSACSRDGKSDKDNDDEKGSNSAKDVASAFVGAYCAGNLKKADGYCLITTETRLERTAKNYDMTLDEYLDREYDCDSMKEYWKEAEEDAKDALEDLYGKHVEVKTEKVRKVSKYTNSQLKSFKENREYTFDTYDLDVDKADAVTEITIQAQIEGSDDSDQYEFTVIVVKYNGTWKILELNQYKL